MATLTALSGAALLIGVCWGSTGLKLSQLFHPEGNVGTILFCVRLPRTLLSYLVGAGLGVCGCCLQGIFQNPMADSHFLGVSSGAGFGAARG